MKRKASIMIVKVTRDKVKVCRRLFLTSVSELDGSRLSLSVGAANLGSSVCVLLSGAPCRRVAAAPQPWYP